MIPLCKISFDNEELEAIRTVFASGWLAHGPQNEEFEREFARFVRTDYAVTVNSCASALFLALKALNITGEVIAPSFTFSATANAIVTAGATPVFADILWETGNINPDDIERRITPNTEAIMPVHFGGQSCRMDQIMKIADKYGLAVIEDSAEAIGAKFMNRCTGSFGVGCFSFFPTKNLTTGEGGMITTNDKNLAGKVRMLSSHGIAKGMIANGKTWRRSAVLPGFNLRMSNVLAAIGVVQLRKLDAMNKKRIHHANYYSEHFKNIVETPTVDQKCNHVYQMYTVKVSDRRDELVAALRSSGIEASVHFDPPVHLQDFYRMKYPANNLEVTERLAQSIITLPLYPDIEMQELDFIINSLKHMLATKRS